MLKITDLGREIRRALKAPNGDPYSQFERREEQFRKVDSLAPEKAFADCHELNKH